MRDLPRPVVKIRWRHIAIAVYALIACTALTVAFYGRIDGVEYHDDVLWGISTGLFVVCAMSALYSMFRQDRFYVRVGLMSAPFLMRGVLYASSPESLPNHNEWAASSINVLVGVLIILLETFDTDAVR